METALRRALIIFGLILCLSMLLQLINYILVFGVNPGNSFGSGVFTKLLGVFGAISGVALHGAVGVLCFYAAHKISPLYTSTERE